MTALSDARLFAFIAAHERFDHASAERGRAEVAYRDADIAIRSTWDALTKAEQRRVNARHASEEAS